MSSTLGMGAPYAPIAFARHVEAQQFPRAESIAARVRQMMKGWAAAAG